MASFGCIDKLLYYPAILQTSYMNLPVLEKAKVFGKTVFLRADLDVPIQSQISNRKTQSHNSNLKSQIVIEDDTRLKAGLPTIEYLLKHGAKVIIGGHLGRPKVLNHESRIMNQEFSLLPVVKWFAKRFNHDSQFIIHDSKVGDFEGWELSDNLFLLENLRFYKGEENPTTASGLEFAKKLASLADIYVNDAFAVCHRTHASIVSVPKYLPHFAGFHLQEEVKVLSSVLDNPKRPLVVIIGGAKIETKLPLVEKMRDFADYVLVGGKIAKEIVPFLNSQQQKDNSKGATLLVADLNQDGFDITPKSIDDFLQIVSFAKTVVWNGPVGMTKSNIKNQISKIDTEKGTRELAKGIVRSEAYTVVGGGDTLGFLRKVGLINQFSFVSTGGGAMLEFLSGKKLPGLIAILS